MPSEQPANQPEVTADKPQRRRYSEWLVTLDRPTHIDCVPLLRLVGLLWRQTARCREVRIYIELLAQMRCRRRTKSVKVKYSLSQLAALTGYNRSRISRSLRRLHELGYIVLGKQAEARGQQSTVTMRFSEAWTAYFTKEADRKPAPNPADNKNPRKNWYIPVFDLEGFRQVLDLDRKAAAMVFVWESWQVARRQCRIPRKTAPESWIGDPLFHARGRRLLIKHKLMPGNASEGEPSDATGG